MNQELESDIDAQHDLIGNPVNSLADSIAQGCFTSERLASTLSASKIIWNTPLKIHSVSAKITSCSVEPHDLVITADGQTSVLDAVVAPITYDLILGKP